MPDPTLFVSYFVFIVDIFLLRKIGNILITFFASRSSFGSRLRIFVSNLIFSIFSRRSKGKKIEIGSFQNWPWKKALLERGVRVHNDLFLPPNGADGWPRDVTFNVVYTRDTREVKRKMGEAQVKGPNCFLNYFSDVELSFHSKMVLIKLSFCFYFSDHKQDSVTDTLRNGPTAKTSGKCFILHNLAIFFWIVLLKNQHFERLKNHRIWPFYLFPGRLLKRSWKSISVLGWKMTYFGGFLEVFPQ